MPLRLEIKRKLAQRSERVKCVDLHPTEPWILASLYSGTVCIWNYQTQTMAKSFEVTELPVRSAKFIARKQWVVAGADDMYIRVYNYNTMDKGHQIEKKHVQRSARVKSLEIHPTEPWILVSLYTGNVQIWNYQSQTVEKNYQVSESPVRSAKFIVRAKSIVVGSDDHFIRVYNYTTEEKTKEFKAHDDYIRSLAVHPTLPYVLSCSDDMMIKLWDLEKDWASTQVFKGHNHYVMQVAFNPKENQTFTSVSLDCTMKMWNLSSSDPILELEAHSKGINCVDFLTCNDRQHLITGSDDHTAKVWDLQTQTCVHILEGHKNNISALAMHPELPALFTGSEDGTFSVWNATNYRLLNTQISELGRIWAIGFARLEGSHMLILGCDEGMIMGKIVCSKTPGEDFETL